MTPKNKGILVRDYKNGYYSARGGYSPNRVQFNSNLKTRPGSRSRSPMNGMPNKYGSNTKKSYDRNRFDHYIERKN